VPAGFRASRLSVGVVAADIAANHGTRLHPPRKKPLGHSDSECQVNA